jgi:hypothetical protein
MNRDMSISRVTVKPSNITREKSRISEFTKKQIIRNYVVSFVKIEVNRSSLFLSINST